MVFQDYCKGRNVSTGYPGCCVYVLTTFRHVEAISNLAATLLALDRREEAMQHWLRAVKLRPSFFEAVEHLIGLLCSSQRGKEAVNIIDYVQNSLRFPKNGDCFATDEHASETESDADSGASSVGSYEKASFDYDDDFGRSLIGNQKPSEASAVGFGSSGYAIPGCDNGRMLALVHAKGNMLYALGDNAGAAAAFEDAVLIAAGRRRHGIQSLIKQIYTAFSQGSHQAYSPLNSHESQEIILLYPDKALQTSKLVFAPCGTPPASSLWPKALQEKPPCRPRATHCFPWPRSIKTACPIFPVRAFLRNLLAFETSWHSITSPCPFNRVPPLPITLESCLLESRTMLPARASSFKRGSTTP